MIKKVIKRIYKIFFKETPMEKFNREEQESYQEWIKNNEPNETELEEQCNTTFSLMPKISIVIPLYNTSKKYFEELIESVNGQTYKNWELCLADGSEEKSNFIINAINLYGDKIKYKFIGHNKGISGNTNEALKLATGEFIALMDHDDLLPRFALFEIVKAINENPDVDFIYTDEDKFYEDSENKIRISPHFKQDYAIDTLRSYNYICHFSVFRKQLLSKTGQFNSEYDGSQDYDFILRATENANKIVHIPKILYNWRISKSSVASGASAKPYAYEAAKRAILSSLERNNIHGAEVEDSRIIGLYKITYPVIKKEKISIIIPNKNNKRQLKRCIDSIRKSSYTNYEIIIVDNNSAEANNLGAEKSTGEYLIFLDSNIRIISKNWLENILANCQRPEVGCVGAKVLYKDNRIKHAGITLNLMDTIGNINCYEKNNNPGYFGRIMIQQNVMAVSGGLIALSKEVFEKINGFDCNFTDEYKDVDLCLKINDIGKSVVYNPYIVAKNDESSQSSDKTYIDSEEKNKIKEKWKKYFEKEDRYFNPNFRKDVPNMRINPQKVEI